MVVTMSAPVSTGSAAVHEGLTAASLADATERVQAELDCLVGLAHLLVHESNRVVVQDPIADVIAATIRARMQLLELPA